MYRYVVVICMLVIVASPIVMGAWSIAFLLGQHVEYYYYCSMYAEDVQIDPLAKCGVSSFMNASK